MRTARTVTPLLIALASALIVVAELIPDLRLRFDSPAAGAIVITARGMAELFVVIVVAQRFRRTASRTDFGIGVGVGMMAAADIVLVLGRATLAPDSGSAAAVLPYHVVGALVLALAALTRPRALVPRARRRMIVAAAGVLALAVVIGQETAVIPGLHLRPSDEPVAIGAFRVALGVLLTAAAAGFVFRREHRTDPLERWLAVALGLAAVVQLDRLLVAPPATASFTWIHVLQLGAAATLLVAAAEEIRFYHRQLAEHAVTEERRRMARELHDGLSQEMAYVASHSKNLAVELHDERLEFIAAAASRALDDSRALVGALRRAPGLPLSASIALQAQELGRRWGVRVELSLQSEVGVAPEKEEAVLRIVGEALANAARHSHAHMVNIRLNGDGGGVHVAVTDDGQGFDPENVDERGFGLRGMRERAQLVGGDVRLESLPGRGTCVDIAIP